MISFWYQGGPHTMINVPHDRASHTLSRPNTAQRARPTLSISSVDPRLPNPYTCCRPTAFLTPQDYCLCTLLSCAQGTWRSRDVQLSCTVHARCACTVQGGREESPKQGRHLSENMQSLLSLFLPSFALGLPYPKYIKDQKKLKRLATNVSSLHRRIFKNSGSSLCSRLVLPRKSKAKYTEKQHKSLSMSSPKRSFANDDLGGTI